MRKSNIKNKDILKILLVPTICIVIHSILQMLLSESDSYHSLAHDSYTL